MLKHILFFASLLVSSVALANGPFQPFQVGAWSGGAYTDDSTGAFSHCAASTTYQSGILFLVAIDQGVTGWSLGFAHPSWSLRDGETIQLDMTFDNRVSFRVFGTALAVDGRANFVKVPMPEDSKLINAFRRAYTMQVFAKGNVYGFNLTTTAQLLPALADCASRNLRAPTQASSAPAEPNVSSLKPDASPSNVTPELQIEAIQMATNFMLLSHVQNPRVSARAETPTGFDAAWTSDEAVGAVRIVPPDPTIKGIDVAAAVAGGDAKECKGKFASGRVSEMVDSEVVFRGFSSCEDTDGTRSAQFFVVPRKQGASSCFRCLSI
jgi:hypothetical protein